MSSARFLLEFEATGDQEVVNAIREVGTAGKETAAELESLQGIEDPFAAVGEGAESAIQPLTEVGTATGELGGIFTEAGGASEEFGGALTGMNTEIEGVAGGLTEANTVVGDFGEAATGAGTSATTAMGGIGQMAGAVTGLGSTIGLAVSTVFRMQDAQLALDKANLKATKSTESARKAAVAFDNLLKSATGNTAGITAARDELSAAQDRLNKLQEAGITSGAEYEAAQAAVGAATAALRGEFAAGGGDVAKFDAALNKMTNTQTGAEIATKSAEKAQRTFSQAALETGLSVASLVGQSVSAVAAIKDIRAGAEKLGGPLKKLAGVFTEGKTGAEGLTTALENSVGVTAIVVAGYKAVEVVLASVETAMAQISGEASKAVEGQIKVLEAGKSSSVGGYIDLIDKIFGTSDALKKSLPQIKADEAAKKKAEQASKTAAAGEKELGDATKKTAADLTGAIAATNGNTTAIAALQRTHSGLQMNIDRSGTSLDDFQKIMHTAKSEMDGSSSSTQNLTQQMYQFYGAMAKTADQALTLSNIFPEMGSNIDNALLGQKQGMDVAVQLWDDFNERVKAGQYEVGEFSKYIQDMGYTLPPAIQAGVDKLTEMVTAVQGVTASSKGAAAGVGIFGSASADLSSTVGKTANAVSDMNLSLVEQEYSLKASTAGLQDLGNQTQGVNNALLEVTNNFEKSNQALREAQAVRDSAVASSEALHTALNNELTALIKEEGALQASIAATQDSAIQTQALSNAKLEGVNAAHEWAASLDESAAAQQAEISTLEQLGHSFNQLPSFIDPTISNLKSFKEAMNEGGQAAIEMGQNTLDAFADMTSNASSSLQGLIDIVRKGGEDMKENTKGWWDEIPAGVAKNFSAAEQEMITHLSNMMAEGQNVLETFEWDLMLSGLPEAASKMEASFRDMAARTKGPMQEIWTTAAAIAATGSDDMIKAMNKAFESGVVGQPLIDQLKNILNSQMPAVGTEAGTAVGKGLDPAAAAAGQSAALTLSQEFAAAGTHIAAVMKGIQANMKLIAPVIDIDIAPAAKKLQSLVATMGTIRQSSVPVFTINVAPALAQLNKIKTALGGVRTGQAGININPAPALASIKKVISEMAKIKQTKIPQIQLNINPAVAAANKIRSIVNALPHIKRSITYTYRVVGSRPNPPDVHKKIVYHYTTVGSRPAQTGMHETLGEDTMIAAHKGERVDISPNTVYSTEHRTAIVPAGGRGKGGEFVIPVTLMLDNKVLVRTVSRGLMEDVGGVS